VADPLYAPIAEGCTHVLALNTAPQGALRSEHSTRLRTVLTAILNRWSPGLGDGYARARNDWDRDAELIGYDRQVRLGPANVMRLAPVAGSHRVTRLSMDRATLLDGARAGYATILRAFEEPAPLYFSVSLSGSQSVDPIAGTV